MPPFLLLPPGLWLSLHLCLCLSVSLSLSLRGSLGLLLSLCLCLILCPLPLPPTWLPLLQLHGRSREQRYTKLADWRYIEQCVTAASPMPLFGGSPATGGHAPGPTPYLGPLLPRWGMPLG